MFFTFRNICFEIGKKHFKMSLTNTILKALCTWFKKAIISSTDLAPKSIPRNFSWHVHPGVERWWHQLTVLTVTDWLRMNAEPDVVSLIPFPQLCMGMRPWTRAGCCEWDRERSGGHRLHVLTRASRRWRGCWFHDMEIDNRCLMPNQSYSCQP